MICVWKCVGKYRPRCAAADVDSVGTSINCKASELQDTSPSSPCYFEDCHSLSEEGCMDGYGNTNNTSLAQQKLSVST